MCGRVSCLSPQLVGIVRFGYASWFCLIPHRGETPPTCVVVVHMCLGLKLIRHMWEASLPDVGLSKTVRHNQSEQYLLIGG